MLPKTESSTVPCSNISSNCVVWQGPDIPCIELCTGDTISDVVAALAQQLCDLVIPEPNLDGLDLLCVLPQGQSQPDTVKDIFQLIVNYICDDEGEGEYQLPTLALPQCLYYNDPTTGDPVTALPLDQYALLLANKICDILQAIDIINVTLSDHETRITVLEDCVLPCTPGGGDPDVFSTCILQNQTVAASVLLLALEEAFCDLQDAVGAPPLVSAAVNQAGCITSSDPMLSSAGTYGGVAGWTSTPTTLSHAVGNAWIVICDMHQAIKDIQLNCCPGACDDVVFAYTTTLVTNQSGVPSGIDFDFSGSNVPSNFNDCGGSTTIVVTDQNGVVANQTFTFVNYAGTNNILTFNLSTTSLNLVDDLDVSISFCITDGVDQCDAVIVDLVESSAPCPTDTQIEAVTDEDAFLTFTNVLGTSAVYTVTLTDLTDGSSNNAFTVTGLGVNASIHLTPLDESTYYSVVLSFQLNGVTQTCGTFTFTTESSIGVPVGQSITASGGAGEYLIPVQVGTGAGTFEVHFNALSVPDRVQIYYNASSNDYANMAVVADSLYVGDAVSALTPPNGVYQNLEQYSYVGDGTGNATGSGQPGSDWNVTPVQVTLTISDSIVCNPTSSKANTDPTNGAARNGAAGAQIGVMPEWYNSQTNYNNNNLSTGGLHANGNVSISFTKGISTSSIMYIRVESQSAGTAWNIFGTDFN